MSDGMGRELAYLSSHELIAILSRIGVYMYKRAPNPWLQFSVPSINNNVKT